MSRPKKKPLELLGGESLEAFGRVNVLRHEEEGTRLLGVADPCDLEDRRRFLARFGGGSYTLVARTPDNGRIAARFRLAFEGAPKPVAGAPLAKPTGRRPAVDAGRWPLGTSEGEIARRVFRLFRTTQDLDEVIDETGLAPRVVRALFLEWLTPLGDELPKTPEEIQRRIEAKRAARLEDWGTDLAARARRKEETKPVRDR